jgi:hypothetical protein
MNPTSLALAAAVPILLLGYWLMTAGVIHNKFQMFLAITAIGLAILGVVGVAIVGGARSNSEDKSKD